MGFFLFLSIMVFSITILGTARRSNQRQDRASKSFWEREAEANSVRRQDISALDYIEVPLERFNIPRLNDLGLTNIANELSKLSTLKIINLSKYTNTELKMMYGPANLNDLSDYDTNFTSYIRLLDKLGKELINANENELAISVLEYAVGIGSDITSTFTMLADMYIQQDKPSKIDNLYQLASSLTSLTKDIILTKLDNIKK